MQQTYSKPPSIAAALNHKSVASPKGSFAEDDDPQLTQALNKSTPAKKDLSRLKNMSPADRAKTGARIGMDVALEQNHGAHGALIGAAIGAVAGRSVGQMQSGEQDQMVRMKRIATTLQNVGIVDEEGNVSFSDGSKVPMVYPPDARLPNTAPKSMGGEPDRSPYEVDSSNPFTKRTVSVARPLARYLANGLLQYNDFKNSTDKSALDNTTAIIVNALQNNSSDISQIYQRAKDLVKKFGTNEQEMRKFFDSLKHNIPEKEAGDIKRGLDILYA